MSNTQPEAPVRMGPATNQPVKPPTLAEAAAASKALKSETTKLAPPLKPLKPAKAAKPAVDAKAKAKADKEKAAAKAAKAKERDAAKKAKADEKADEKAKAKKVREAERAAARAKRLAEGGPERLVPADLSKYNVDKVKKTAGGHASVDSNDTLAQKLRGKTLDDVYAEAAKVLNEPEKELRAKYGHLNVGMQRMNLGNRMRAETTGKKEDKPAKVAKAAKLEAKAKPAKAAAKAKK